MNRASGRVVKYKHAGGVYNPLFGPHNCGTISKKRARRVLLDHAERERARYVPENPSGEDYSHFYAMERAYKDRRRAR